MEFCDIEEELAVFDFKSENAFEHFMRVLQLNEVDFTPIIEEQKVILDSVGPNDPLVINSRYSVQELYEHVCNIHKPKHVQKFLGKILNGNTVGWIVKLTMLVLVVGFIFRGIPMVISSVRDNAIANVLPDSIEGAFLSKPAESNMLKTLLGKEEPTKEPGIVAKILGKDLTKEPTKEPNLIQRIIQEPTEVPEPTPTPEPTKKPGILKRLFIKASQPTVEPTQIPTPTPEPTKEPGFFKRLFN